MNYTKPEVAVLGEAVRVIESSRQVTKPHTTATYVLTNDVIHKTRVFSGSTVEP